MLYGYLRHHRRASFHPVSELSSVPVYGESEVVHFPGGIPRKNLCLTGEGEISAVNLKCDSSLIGSFRIEPGIFPGWHMNKAH